MTRGRLPVVLVEEQGAFDGVRVTIVEDPTSLAPGPELANGVTLIGSLERSSDVVPLALQTRPASRWGTALASPRFVASG